MPGSFPLGYVSELKDKAACPYEAYILAEIDSINQHNKYLKYNIC